MVYGCEHFGAVTVAECKHCDRYEKKEPAAGEVATDVDKPSEK